MNKIQFGIGFVIDMNDIHAIHMLCTYDMNNEKMLADSSRGAIDDLGQYFTLATGSNTYSFVRRQNGFKFDSNAIFCIPRREETQEGAQR